jgi:ABC-type lipoprotein release transport system permease subunit
LLLFGLKNGIIDTMRDRLLRDPSSREIFPKDRQNKPFPDEWFTQTMERSEVEFVIPRLDVSGDLTIHFSSHPGENTSFPTNCEVTAKGDPRLAMLGFEAPLDGQVALTLSLAEKLGVQKGGTVTALVSRGGSGSPFETVEATLMVCAVVEETVPANRAWLPLSFLVGVGDFREYIAVPEFGWPGTDDDLEPRYDALLTLVDRALESDELDLITKKPPGLTNTRVLDSDELFRLTGLSTNDAPPPSAIVWRAVGNLIPQTAIRELKNRLAEIGVQVVVLPLIDPVPVDIGSPDGSIHSLNLIVLEESRDSRETSNVEVAEIRQAFNSSWHDSLFRSVSSAPATCDDGEVLLASFSKVDRGEPDKEGDSPVLSEEVIGMPISFNSMPIVPKSAADSFMAKLAAEGATTPKSTEGLTRADSTEPPLQAVEHPALSGRMLSVDAQISLNESKTGKIEGSETLAGAKTVRIEISDSLSLPEREARLIVDGLAGHLDVPVLLTKKKGVPEGFALVGALQGGRIRRALVEPVVFQEELGRFQRKQEKFRDFRLFAATLEDVAPLAREFEAMGIPVRHDSDRIAQILELDANLTRLFWIIASAAAGAGFFGLVASFFAAVERKRRELGVLQLLGMPKLYLFAFPMLQSAFLSFGAFVLAFFLFEIFADLINTQFASELREGETFCSLRRDHALSVLKATMGFGLVASLFAAVRSFRIQPSEALRTE